MTKEKVLVTGGSGFLAAHCIVQLLKEGYAVRTTVRSIKRENDVRTMVANGGIVDTSDLSFTIANLMNDKGWTDAVKNCIYVLHTASPFPSQQPQDENELIIPARDGALRVLKAARDANIKRVVLTSSFAAVGYSPKRSDEPYTEADWTNTNQPGIAPYIKSKTVAEQAAWDFIKKQGDGLELSVINPTGILGPTFGSNLSSSLLMIKNMLDGKMPFVPNISIGVVDVRDVADAHLKAMTNPRAIGERFIVCGDKIMSFPDIAKILKKELGQRAAKVSTRVIPDWLIRLGAPFNAQFRQLAPQIGKRKMISNEKAKRVLHWKPRSIDETVSATGQSLLAYGVVK